MKMGKCVVIGMQSTGEARTLEQLERDEGELTDFVSTSKLAGARGGLGWGGRGHKTDVLLLSLQLAQ